MRSLISVLAVLVALAGPAAAAVDKAPALATRAGAAPDPKQLQGGAEAQSLFDQASAFHHGDGVTADLPRAIGLYRKAAALGHVTAMSSLAQIYGEGGVVPIDYAAALAQLKAASDLGDAYATFNLAVVYYQGEGVSLDQAEAARLYALALEGGVEEAAFRLGRLHEEGEGLPYSLEKAAKYYRVGAAAESHAVRERAAKALARVTKKLARRGGD